MITSICIAQQNYVVGDMSGNAQKIIEAAQQAYANGAHLLMTPELALCGYAAEDLLLRKSFQQASVQALEKIVEASLNWPAMALLVGHSQDWEEGGRSWNAASWIVNGRIVATYAKQLLPNYGVFDEMRYFETQQRPCVVELNGIKVGILICEDVWQSAPAQAAKDAGAQLLLTLNASPFHENKALEREQILAQRALENQLPLVYAHLVGGQDELIFDGASFAVQSDGQVAMRAHMFEPELVMLDAHVDDGQIRLQGQVKPVLAPNAQIWSALVLGVRDYVHKNGFPGALLGLSGGIDSALVLAIAVDALGKDRVRTVMMPSPYTADISLLDAQEMAQRLGVAHEVIPIAGQFDAFKRALKEQFLGTTEDTTEENLQARIRGTLLMALSNKFGSIVLTTGNKSELATGYCTLYGDMAGGYAVIKDVLKTRVFDLALWRNLNDPFGTGEKPIPDRIITRPPSAELKPDQKDEDSLPPYPVLDDIVQRYINLSESVSDIVSAGHSIENVERIARLIRVNEYKRRQAPIGPKISSRSFGKDWRMPITNRFRD